MFDVFINATCLNGLIEDFGKDDVAWIGKSVEVVTEQEKHFKKDMIVLKPLKE